MTERPLIAAGNAQRLVLAGPIHTIDAACPVISDGALAIGAGRIIAVGEREQLTTMFPDAERVDRRGCMMLPGLVDVHHHPGLFFFSRLRPRVDPPVPGLLSNGGRIEAFLNLLVPTLGMNPEETFAAARASLLRGLKTGTTFFNDAAGGDVEGLVRAAADLELRGILTYDFGADLAFDCDRASHSGCEGAPTRRIADVDRLLADAERAVRVVDEAAGLRGWYNVLCDLTTSDALYRGTADAARRDGRGINTHTSTVARHDPVSERLFGARSMRRVLDLGVVGPLWIGAHMGFLDDAEIRDLAAAGGHVAHCPGTAMGAGKGIVHARAIPRMLAAGVNVALGTDSAQWADLPGQMGLAYYGHKDAVADDSILPPERVLRMATLDAARACGVDHEIGSLAAGKRADFVLVDCQALHFAAFADPLYAWLRSGHSSDIAEVWLAGEPRVVRGETAGVDEAAIIAAAVQAGQHFVARRNGGSGQTPHRS